MTLLYALSIIASACSPMLITPISTLPVPSKTDTPFPPESILTPTLIQTQTSQPTPTSTVAPYLNISSQSLKGVQVQLWHPWSGNTARQLDSLVDEFNHDNEWGIIVESHAAGSTGELFNQVKESLSDNSKPHIVASPIEHLLSWEQIQKDILVDLTGYVNSSEWGMSQEEIAKIPAMYWDKIQDGGELIGLPAQRTLHVLFYNQAWAKEMGFNNAPESFGEFAEQSCAAAAANLKDGTLSNDGTGGWIVTNDALTTLSWIRVFGDPRLPLGETTNYYFNNPVVSDAFTSLRQLYDENCAWISREPQSYDYFADREAMFYSGTIQDIAIQERAQIRLGKSDQWTIIPYPTNDGKPVLLVSGPSYAILRSSYAEQMASWLFIRWMSQAAQEVRMIEVTSTLPVSLSTAEQLQEYGMHHPQWEQTLSWLPIEQKPPELASWRVVRNLLEDAAWQIFYTDLNRDKIPVVLTQLDDMIPEVLSHEDH